MQSERASDQTSTGWNIEVGRAGVISTPCEIDEGGRSCGRVPRVYGRVLLGGALSALRVSGVSWVLNLRPSSLPPPCLTRGIIAPLSRVRSISRVTLELVGKGAERVGAGQHTFPNPRVPPSQTR